MNTNNNKVVATIPSFALLDLAENNQILESFAYIAYARENIAT